MELAPCHPLEPRISRRLVHVRKIYTALLNLIFVLYVSCSWMFDGNHVNFEGSRLEDNEEEEVGQY
jgi:hypothetical protein